MYFCFYCNKTRSGDFLFQREGIFFGLYIYTLYGSFGLYICLFLFCFRFLPFYGFSLILGFICSPLFLVFIYCCYFYIFGLYICLFFMQGLEIFWGFIYSHFLLGFICYLFLYFYICTFVFEFWSLYMYFFAPLSSFVFCSAFFFLIVVFYAYLGSFLLGDCLFILFIWQGFVFSLLFSYFLSFL